MKLIKEFLNKNFPQVQPIPNELDFVDENQLSQLQIVKKMGEI